jgi:hypothetical protein
MEKEKQSESFNPLTGQDYEAAVMQEAPPPKMAPVTPQEPVAQVEPLPEPAVIEGLSQIIATRPQMNQGIGSFANLLSPILQSVERQNKMKFKEKMDPYVQQVQQLTQETFPNIDFNMLNGFGGGP